MINPNAKAQQIKDEASALLTYANGITSASDLTLGDAVRTLAEGYGQGGGSDSKWELYDLAEAKLFFNEFIEDPTAITPSTTAQKLRSKSVVNHYFPNGSFLLRDYDALCLTQEYFFVDYLNDDHFPRTLGQSSRSLYLSRLRRYKASDTVLYRNSIVQSSDSTHYRYQTVPEGANEQTTSIGIYANFLAPYFYVSTLNYGSLDKATDRVSYITNFGLGDIYLKSDNGSRHMVNDSWNDINFETSYVSKKLYIFRRQRKEAFDALSVYAELNTYNKPTMDVIDILT